jgi:glycosyltransferase involved in cell wall biosynthesis
MRLLWILRLAWSCAVGWLVRSSRRIGRRGPRIWHGTFPMHMVKDMVDVDRRAGFKSASIVHHTLLNSSYSLVTPADFDIVLSDRGYKWDVLHWVTLCHLLRSADIFVMFFDTRFSAPTQPKKLRLALALLRWFGVRLIAVPNGLDVVSLNGWVSRFGFLERLQKDYPHWDMSSDAANIRQNVETICSQVDFVVSQDSYSGRFLTREDLRFKYYPVNVAASRPTSSARIKPRIVHAPNHRFIKGTDSLIAATDRLREAGWEFELALIEKVARPEALRLYADADIIADQFCIGAFGVFALEGLALGKPVLAYLDEEHLGDPVFNLPIVNANPENLERILAVLLGVPELRERLGRAGRTAIERYQSPEALSEVWTQVYRHVWWSEPLKLETTQHFSPEREPRSFSEDPALELFWPVPVRDLMPEIQRALEGTPCSA